MNKSVQYLIKTSSGNENTFRNSLFKMWEQKINYIQEQRNMRTSITTSCWTEFNPNKGSIFFTSHFVKISLVCIENILMSTVKRKKLGALWPDWTYCHNSNKLRRNMCAFHVRMHHFKGHRWLIIKFEYIYFSGEHSIKQFIVFHWNVTEILWFVYIGSAFVHRPIIVLWN